MTKFYLRDLAGSTIGASENSTALPVGTANILGTSAAKLLSETIGTLETSVLFASLAQTAHQDTFARMWSTDPLGDQVIAAATWTIAVDVIEGNASANAFTVLSLYVWRPSTSAVVGFLYDSDTPLGTEWPTGGQGRVMTFAGGAVTAAAGDLIVLECWTHAVQAAATSYNCRYYYDGTVDVTAGSSTSAGSYLSVPQTLTYYTDPPPELNQMPQLLAQ